MAVSFSAPPGCAASLNRRMRARRGIVIKVPARDEGYERRLPCMRSAMGDSPTLLNPLALIRNCVACVLFKSEESGREAQ